MAAAGFSALQSPLLADSRRGRELRDALVRVFQSFAAASKPSVEPEELLEKVLIMGKLTSTFAGLKAGLQTPDESEDTDGVTQFDLMKDVFGVIGQANYYNYQGYLTTPGCNENITWYLMANPMSASPLQILDFTSMLAAEQGGAGRGGDNRLVQSLNGRAVTASFPAPGGSKTITSSLSLTGITAAQFQTTAVRTAFVNSVATAAGVASSAVTITSVVDVVARRRSLLAASSVTTVTFTVTAPTASAAANVQTMLAAASAGGASAALVTSLSTAITAAGGPTTTGVDYVAAVPVASAAAPRAAGIIAVVATAAMALAF